MPEIPAIQTPRSSAIRIWILSACLLIFVLGLGAWGVLKWRYRVMPFAPSQTRVVARLSASPGGASSPAPQKHDSPVQIIPEYEQTGECADPTRRDVVRRLTEELKPDVPDLAGILLPDEPEEPEKVYPALLRLLESAKTASAERRPALLLASDLVAERINLPNIYPPSPEVQRKLDELASSIPVPLSTRAQRPAAAFCRRSTTTAPSFITHFTLFSVTLISASGSPSTATKS